MSSMGTTKYVACPNGWTNLVTLYDDPVTNQAGWVVSVLTNNVQYASGKTLPTISTGHPVYTGDTMIYGEGDLLNIWFKNAVSGTVGNLAITPQIAY